MNSNISPDGEQFLLTNGQGQILPKTQSLNPAFVYLAQLRPQSRQTMRRNLDLMAGLLTNRRCDAKSLDWAQLRYQHTIALRTVLLELYAPSTVNQMLTALRRVLSEARKLKLISSEDYVDAIELPRVSYQTELKGRYLHPHEVTALMQVATSDESVFGFRDSALLAIVIGAGLRRGEVVALRLGDFDLTSGDLHIRGAKGGKSRIVPLPQKCQLLVKAWLAVRSMSPGPLLMAISKGKELLWRSLSSQSVLYILQKRAQQAEISSCSPHDCRRTYISNLLEAGVDIVTVSQLAGHSSTLTTAKYDRRGDEVKRRAVELLPLSW
ncbi:tyrosine-type recombinase/integrase [Gloeothece verrucosa]|uniref:Integrase family protein n=1 Tax=Gloeothece verrucosa (strain PCC 7822) TaxID=497965 RepID=E0UM30_GLOV7|nr:site-specific integrase [Gloeothece verrucosa]ADN18010.1 integrase family protein [Gloeothece verrucosa PCC 7822]